MIAQSYQPMEQIEYKRIAEHEDTYWWHIGRRKVIQSFFEKYIDTSKVKFLADIGCGTGGNYKLLKKYGRVTGVDMHKDALKFCRRSGAYDDLLQDDATSLPANSFNVISAFDVLEHIKEDETALVAWHTALTENGSVVITVPAFQFLFGAHDRMLHHVRRYNKEDLSEKLIRAGFREVHISYFFFFTFPLLITVRLLNKSGSENSTYKQTPSPAAWLFTKLSAIEAWSLARNIYFPFGSSIIAIAHK